MNVSVWMLLLSVLLLAGCCYLLLSVVCDCFWCCCRCCVIVFVVGCLFARCCSRASLYAVCCLLPVGVVLYCVVMLLSLFVAGIDVLGAVC